MQTVSINEIILLIKDDVDRVNTVILSQLNSSISLINQIGHYIISSGGKRIRPIVAILSAKALNYTGDQHITTAAFIEFIHTATLMHDDVVDNSDMRRGQSTANIVYGNAASVLVGDFIYTRAFQMMTSIRSFKALDVMSTATNIISEGEVQQLMHCNNPDISEKDYLNVIYRKTARLFESAAQTAAIVAQANDEQENALKNYGCHLGTAFQLIDDMLDYSAEDDQHLGKKLGDDLSEGKCTLPLLHAMHHGTEEETILIQNIVRNGGGRHLLNDVVAIMKKYDSLQYTKNLATKEAQKAIRVIAILPDSIYKQALIDLAQLSVQRQY